MCREAWSQAAAVGLDVERLTLVQNGVDLTVYHPTAADKSVFEIRSACRPTIFDRLVGRLAWEKGPDKFVRAAQHILRHHPEVHFARAGTGLMEKELRVDRSKWRYR